MLDEIVVTGSYIQGTAEDAALPVDVISRMTSGHWKSNANRNGQKYGVSSGNLGETNQFDTRRHREMRRGHGEPAWAGICRTLS